MAFSVPPNGGTFYSGVVERANDLIQIGVWSGIQHVRLRTWLNNFTTEHERYFAACLLDGLIYRSELQTEALTTQLFQRAIPDLCRAFPTPLGQIDSWLDLFSANSDPGARLVAVLKPDDPPGKSGDVIARLLKRGFRLNQQLLVQPTDCEELHRRGVKTFIFVDDFLGTGHQFEEMLIESGISGLIDASFMLYAPLTAHTDGIAHLHRLFPQLKVCCGELLDESHSAFNAKSTMFSDGVNSPGEAKRFYYEMLHKKRVSFDLNTSAAFPTSTPPNSTSGSYTLAARHRRGYGELELAYAFYHSVPDNCLPALWWSHSSNWSPLFNR